MKYAKEPDVTNIYSKLFVENLLSNKTVIKR